MGFHNVPRCRIPIFTNIILLQAASISSDII
jgi:hypothetical protein